MLVLVGILSSCNTLVKLFLINRLGQSFYPRLKKKLSPVFVILLPEVTWQSAQLYIVKRRVQGGLELQQVTERELGRRIKAYLVVGAVINLESPISKTRCRHTPYAEHFIANENTIP
jgi:hypothetical protein